MFSIFDSVTKIGIWGILFFIPISNSLIDSFIGLAFLGFIGKKIIRPDLVWLKKKENLFLAFFFIFMGLSLFHSGQYFGKSFMALFFKWGKFIVLFLIVQDSISRRRDLLISVFIFLFSAGLAAVSGITQFLGWGEFLRGREILIMKGGVRAITSSFNHCNGFGAYLIIPFSLCIAFLKSPRALKPKLYSLILFLAIILAFCIFHTYSRGAWVGVFAALITMMFISRRLILILLVFIFCGIISLIPTFRGIAFSIFDSNGDSDRFRYWQAALSMFRENPFLGKGLGTFMARFSEYLPGTNISYAHNCYLQIMAESGIFSLLAFLGSIFMVLNNGIKRFFSERDPVILGGVCGLVGFLVHSFFEVNLYSLPLAALFWLWLGIVSVLGSGKLIEKTGE